MNITSIKMHLEAINELLNLPLVKQSEIQRHLNFVTAFPLFLFKIPAGTHVYRATTSFKNEYFDTTYRISYPPKNCVQNYGRANIPGQSLFYCSEDQATSYLELINYWVQNISLGQFFHVTMGEWEIMDIVESIIVTSPNQFKRQSTFEISSGNAFDHFAQHFNPSQQEVAHLVYERLHDWFSRPARVGNDIYKVTASISNKFFKSGKKEQIFKNAAISYPSVANYEEGVNFAFEPKIVDSGKLSLRSVWRIKLLANQNENGFYHFKEVDREYGTIDKDGSLKWSKK